ncbi:MAG: hypothetical protein ACRD6W_15085 [Nitrososphaerales archaeon]
MTVLQQHGGTPTYSLLDQTTSIQLVTALSDDYARRIILAVIEKGKTVQEISAEQSIPLSTCYKRGKELLDRGLLFIQRIVLTNNGKKRFVYRSSLTSVQVSLDIHGITVKAERAATSAMPNERMEVMLRS